MNIRGLFKRSKTNHENPSESKGILHLWEDDYLMLELLPKDNLEFVKAETRRINNFSKEHFDGTGFTSITPISEKPIKTIEKLIPVSEVESLMLQSGLQKITTFNMQGVGIIKGDNAPLGFGKDNFAILCNRKNGILEDIWITGNTNTDDNKNLLSNALTLFGKTFKFIAVNWYKSEYYDLTEGGQPEEFVKNSC